MKSIFANGQKSKKTFLNLKPQLDLSDPECCLAFMILSYTKDPKTNSELSQKFSTIQFLKKNNKLKTRFVVSDLVTGAHVDFKTWCGHQYRVGIICPPPWLR